MATGRRASHKLHLVLNAEKFVLRVESSMSTIRKPRDELVSGNISIVVFGQLVCEGTVSRDGGKREVSLYYGGLVLGIFDRQFTSSNGGNLTTMAEVGLAVHVR